MNEVNIIGIDLAENSFQLHGSHADGSVAFRKKLGRNRLMTFLAEQPHCIVAMEACATAHSWGREISDLGHVVKLIPPQYVKPYVKRQKNDATDAEAIAEAASRPTMRFVEIKSSEQQARAMVFRTRQLFVRQRTQTINALRGHLAEHGVIAPKSKAGIKKLAAIIEDENVHLDDLVRSMGRVYLEQIELLARRISSLTLQLNREAKASDTVRQLRTIPGVGLMTASAIDAFAPDMASFRRGRDFAAWIGLVPKQHSTGGKESLGKVSKKGQKDIRSLLITGAMSVVNAAIRFGVKDGTWLARMLARKPMMLVAIALANRMARAIWAMKISGQNYRQPVANVQR